MKTRLSEWLSPKPYKIVIEAYSRFKKEGDIDRLLFFKSFVYTCLDAMKKSPEHGGRFESYINMVGSDILYSHIIGQYYKDYKEAKIPYHGVGYIQLYEEMLWRYILR